MRLIVLVAALCSGCVSFEDYCGRYYQNGSSKWSDCVVSERREFQRNWNNAWKPMQQQNNAPNYRCSDDYAGGVNCTPY